MFVSGCLAHAATPKPNCASPSNPPRYAPIVAGEYITAKYDASYWYRRKG